MTDTPVVSQSPERADNRYRDLFGRRSVLGALAVVGVLCLFGFGIQALDEAVKRSSTFAVGDAYVVSPTTSFTPAPGWTIDPGGTVEGQIVTAHKHGWTLKVSGIFVLPEGTTFDSFTKVFYDGDTSNGSYTVVSDRKPFTTTSGQNGVTWEAHGPKEAAIQYYVANGANVASMRTEGPASTQAGLRAEIEEMAKSLVVTAPEEESGS